MQIAWDKGYTKVIFKGDCRNLVDIVNKSKISLG